MSARPRASQISRSFPISHGAPNRCAEDRLRPRTDRALRRVHVDVQRLRIDVDENGDASFVQHGVRGGRERERRQHDLVTGADPARDHREVERGRARRGRDRVRQAHERRELFFELGGRRSLRDPAGPQHLADRLFLLRPEARARERNHFRPPAWRARYQFHVRRRPSSSEVGGRKPVTRVSCVASPT